MPAGEPKRVLIISSAARAGGGELSLLTALAHVDVARFRLAFACPPPEDETDDMAVRAEALGMATTPLPLRRLASPASPADFLRGIASWPGARRAIARAAHEIGADLIHANDLPAAVQSPSSASRRLTMHARDVRVPRPARAFLRGRVHATAAISGFVAGHFRRWGFPRVVVAPNGIPDAFFPSAPPPAARFPGERPYWLMVAQPVAWKRHDVFFEALALVRRARPGVRGALAGVSFAPRRRPRRGPATPTAYNDAEFPLTGPADGGLPFGAPWPARAERPLARLARRAGVTDAVDWLGGVPWERMPGVYARAAVCAHPAADEPWGRSVAEAMAGGVPVAAADGGGAAELLAGGGGTLVTPGDPAALARAMLAYLDDPAKAAADGAAGRAAAARFTPETSGRALGDFWENALT